jgi:hypothetical protein
MADVSNLFDKDIGGTPENDGRKAIGATHDQGHSRDVFSITSPRCIVDPRASPVYAQVPVPGHFEKVM